MMMLAWSVVICSFLPFPSTGDEMFSDAFKVKESENGIFFEVEGKVSSKPHVQRRIYLVSPFSNSLFIAALQRNLKCSWDTPKTKLF